MEPGGPGVRSAANVLCAIADQHVKSPQVLSPTTHTSRQTKPGTQPRSARRRRVVARWLVLAGASIGVLPGLAMAGGPPATPGPPPGNAGDLPVSPGTELIIVPAGVGGTIAGSGSGPGLLNGAGAPFNRASRTFSIAIACQANGSIAITMRRLSKSVVARSSYRCSGGRATPKFRVTPKIAAGIVRNRIVATTATVRQGGASVKLYLNVRTRLVSSPGFWTDGNLQCTPVGSTEPLAYLAAPDFTAKAQTPISTRGWVAWYTVGGGWHWLGPDGENASRWQTWIATPTGVLQFHPNGAPNPVPWTFGPISIPGGQGVVAVGVYEVIYWVAGKPEYSWKYVNAGSTGAVAAGGGTHFCSYP